MEPTGEARSSSSVIFRTALAIAGILIVSGLVYLAIQLSLLSSLTKEIPPGFRVAFGGNGTYQYFEFAGDSLIPSSGAQGPDGTVIRESVELEDGSRVVIAALPGTERMMVGVISVSGTFMPLHEERRLIANLSVSNGKAAFSIFPEGVGLALPAEPAVEGAENNVVEEGSAEGPPAEFSTFVPLPLPEIAVVDINNGPALRKLGTGTSPRFHPDGSLVAVSEGGIIRISIADGKRSMVLEIPPEDSIISPDGSLVALRTSDSTFDLYDISVRATHVGTAAQAASVSEAAFLDNERLILRTGDRASIFVLKDAETPVQLLAIMPIAQ